MFVFFILYVLIIMAMVYLLPTMVALQTMVSWFAIGGMVLFWFPEIVWKRLKR